VEQEEEESKNEECEVKVNAEDAIEDDETTDANKEGENEDETREEEEKVEEATLEESKNETTESTPADNNKTVNKSLASSAFDNDSAAVVQYLSFLRLTVGPCPLSLVHDSSILGIIEKSSGYQIHVPRTLNSETIQTKYAMMDIEFFSKESAKECKEALIEHFKDHEGVKVENWPESKIYYNDYGYLNIDESIVDRCKQGVLIAGYSKLRDRWICGTNCDPSATKEDIKELVGKPFVDCFFKNNKVFIRMDTKENAKNAVGKSFTVNDKVIRIRELFHHPSEKSKFNSNIRNRRNNNQQMNTPYQQSYSNGPYSNGNYYGHQQPHYAPPPQQYYQQGPPQYMNGPNRRQPEYQRGYYYDQNNTYKKFKY